MKYSVAEIAEMYGVTSMAVRYWIKQGLEFSRRREIGRKEYIVINKKDVDKYLKLTER